MLPRVLTTPRGSIGEATTSAQYRVFVIDATRLSASAATSIAPYPRSKDLPYRCFARLWPRPSEEFVERGWNVTATVRDVSNAESLNSLGKVRLENVDIVDPGSSAGLAEPLAGKNFDAVIINAGISGPRASPQAVDHNGFTELFVTNALAPVRLAEMLVSSVKPQTGAIGFMTSKLGSVADRAAWNSTGQQGSAELLCRQLFGPPPR